MSTVNFEDLFLGSSCQCHQPLVLHKQNVFTCGGNRDPLGVWLCFCALAPARQIKKKPRGNFKPMEFFFGKSILFFSDDFDIELFWGISSYLFSSHKFYF
jgi:hypothetical protein